MVATCTNETPKGNYAASLKENDWWTDGPLADDHPVAGATSIATGLIRVHPKRM